MTPSRSEFIFIRGLRYHIRHWGQPEGPRIFMLHGWMDVSASFQFVVDALQRGWHVIAPDWRGFGLTDKAAGGTYWIPDYLADLDAILRHYTPGEPARIVGHSLGGNVAMIYGGARPERVAKLVNLEGFGLQTIGPEHAPQRYAAWLNEELDPPVMSDYPSCEAVAQRLKKNNPRLSDEKAYLLAQHWASQGEDGRWHILGDPAHKRINPVLYRIDEVLACWSRIAAQVLWIEAEHPHFLCWMNGRQAAREEVDRRIATIPQVTQAMVENAGHMLHHDQPTIVAGMIESFFAS